MVAEGLVKSFARPNGNITGISIFGAELEGMRQDILIEAVPGIRQMAALADPSITTEAKARALQEAARAKNVELSIYRVTRAEEIAATIDKAQASGATALNVLGSGMLDGNGRPWPRKTRRSTPPGAPRSMPRRQAGRKPTGLSCARSSPGCARATSWSSPDSIGWHAAPATCSTPWMRSPSAEPASSRWPIAGPIPPRRTAA